MKVIKGILIDTEDFCSKVVSMGKTWSNYVNTLGSNKIEILVKKIGNKNFAIMIEEETPNNSSRVISGSSSDYEEILYGNLLIFGIDESDELTSLSDSDISLIFDNIHSYKDDTTLRQRIEFER